MIVPAVAGIARYSRRLEAHVAVVGLGKPDAERQAVSRPVDPMSNVGHGRIYICARASPG